MMEFFTSILNFATSEPVVAAAKGSGVVIPPAAIAGIMVYRAWKKRKKGKEGNDNGNER